MSILSNIPSVPQGKAGFATHAGRDGSEGVDGLARPADVSSQPPRNSFSLAVYTLLISIMGVSLRDLRDLCLMRDAPSFGVLLGFIPWAPDAHMALQGLYSDPNRDLRQSIHPHILTPSHYSRPPTDTSRFLTPHDPVVVVVPHHLPFV